ncbi:MAG: hypothetical protein ABIS36_04105 [Chryseolinea sp.]
MTQAEFFKIGINNNPALKGNRGRVGEFVCRQVNGVTIVSRRPKRPTSQSEGQRKTRQRFRQATEFAKREMMNADRKAYYKLIAQKKGLPNAYTAAIKAYMCKPIAIQKNENVSKSQVAGPATVKRSATSVRGVSSNSAAIKKFPILFKRLIGRCSDKTDNFEERNFNHKHFGRISNRHRRKPRSVLNTRISGT